MLLINFLIIYFLEEMLNQRKQIYHQVCLLETDVVSPEFRLEELASKPVELVKAAAEQTSRALPESGTRAISSLWGKISQLPVIQNVAAELKGRENENLVSYWTGTAFSFMIIA